MFKRIITLLFLTAFICCGCGKKEEIPVANDLNDIIKRDNIVVGIKTDTYPFGFYDQKGHIVGYDAALAKLIARGIVGSEKKVKFVPVTASDRIMKLYSGDIDMIIATMSINSTRSHIVDFTNPYFIAGQALMVPSGSKVNSIESLNTKKAGIILGTTCEKTIRHLAPNATIIGRKTYSEVFNLLKENKVDAILADDSILYGFVMDNRGYKILPARYTKEYYSIALRKGDESKELKEELNKLIDFMQQSGRLNRIKEKWIPNLHKS